MKYGRGTIVFVRRTKFADNGKYDNRSGHPGILPIASHDISSETYYLLLTSNVGRKLIYPDQYYDLSDDWEKVKLKKPSLINLKDIYKGRIEGDKLGGLYPQLYREVISELKAYQEIHPCKLYEEIKNRI